MMDFLAKKAAYFRQVHASASGGNSSGGGGNSGGGGQGGGDYTVSGASTSAMNGDYCLDSSKTGYNASPVFTNGTYYLFRAKEDESGFVFWVLGTTVRTMPDYIYEVGDTYSTGGDNSTPATSGWNNNVTVTAN